MQAFDDFNPPVFDPPVGIAEDLGGGVRRILAPNPSPMTFRGTNTYIVGRGHVAVIDPGPLSKAHLAAILDAVKAETVTHIFVTHSHLDHSPLARPLSQATGAPVLAYGASDAGRSAVMRQLAKDGLAGGGEGVDADFAPDELLFDTQTVSGEDWSLTAIRTPGHFGNHLCFAMGDTVFTGDHVMGWASSLVSPPDGDLTAFMASCDRLAQVPARVFHAGHGAPVTDPAQRLHWLIAHRKSREAQILEALDSGCGTATSLTRKVYTDINPALLPAAMRNVFAHLIDLEHRNLVSRQGPLSTTARFSRL